MKKIVVSFVIIVFLVLVGGIIYLFNRPSDYQAHFTVKTTPDVAYFNILNWDIWNRNQLLSKIEVLSKTPVSNISKKVTVVE